MNRRWPVHPCFLMDAVQAFLESRWPGRLWQPLDQVCVRIQATQIWR
jgi:hypothetical protein